MTRLEKLEPYGPRIRKVMADAQRVGATISQVPDLLWVDGHWWTVLPLFATYRGVRFRIEGNRLRLMPQLKVPING